MPNWLPPGEIPLKGFKIRELALRENVLTLRLTDRRDRSVSLALHGPVSLRDRGALGKTLWRVLLEDFGPLKRLTVAGVKPGPLLSCECMEAERLEGKEGKPA